MVLTRALDHVNEDATLRVVTTGPTGRWFARRPPGGAACCILSTYIVPIYLPLSSFHSAARPLRSVVYGMPARGRPVLCRAVCRAVPCHRPGPLLGACHVTGASALGEDAGSEAVCRVVRPGPAMSFRAPSIAASSPPTTACCLLLLLLPPFKNLI